MYKFGNVEGLNSVAQLVFQGPTVKSSNHARVCSSLDKQRVLQALGDVHIDNLSGNGVYECHLCHRNICLKPGALYQTLVLVQGEEKEEDTAAAAAAAAVAVAAATAAAAAAVAASPPRQRQQQPGLSEFLRPLLFKCCGLRPQ